MKKFLKLLFIRNLDSIETMGYCARHRANQGVGTCLGLKDQFLLWLFQDEVNAYIKSREV